MIWIYLREFHKLPIQNRNARLKLAEEFEFQIKHYVKIKIII